MMEELPHILVVDDDRRLRELLQRYIGEQGFRVTTGENAENARIKLRSFDFDLLVIDIMMPGEDGLALTKSLREETPVPILLLTAMGEAEDRIQGLECGADDYLTKPFEPRELVLRINAILRRTPSAAFDAEALLSFGRFSFDFARDELLFEGNPVHLTTVETTLLKALATRAGNPVRRDHLCEASGLATNERTIDVQVARLRRKIEENPRYPRYLQTVRGIGYILMAG